MITLPIFIGIVGSLAGLLALGAFLYWQVFMDRNRLSQRLDKLSGLTQAEKRFEATLEQAEAVLAAARAQAVEIVQQAHRLSAQVDEGVEKIAAGGAALQKEAVSRVVGELEAKVSSQIREELAKVSEAGAKLFSQELVNWREALVKKAADLELSVKQSYTAVEVEVADYRKRRMNGLDKGMEKLMREFVRQALGKSLTQAEQEALIVRGLSQAKSDGVLARSNEPKTK